MRIILSIVFFFSCLSLTAQTVKVSTSSTPGYITIAFAAAANASATSECHIQVGSTMEITEEQ